MTKLITSNFETHNAKQFVESLDETANSIYYVTLGKHTAFSDDNTPPNPGASIEDSYYQIYRDMIYGKQITTADIKHMIDHYSWTSGTKYAQYEHTQDMRNKKFFVIVQESGGDYSVFKCLFNNKGAASTDKPQLDETSADDDIYITTGDKYQWKYMFKIPEATYNKFQTSDKIPVVVDANVTGNAVAGAIDVVDVKSGGSRYFSVANGVVKVAAVGGDDTIVELESLTGANATITLNSTHGDNPGNYTVPEKLRLYGKHANGDPDTTNNVANAVILEANTTFLRVAEIAGDFFGQTTNVFAVGSTSNQYATMSSVTAATSALSANTDFYKGSTFYIKAGAGAGQAKTISEYIVTGSARRIKIPSAFSTSIDSTSLFEITPRVTITGDGSGAEGRAIINTSTYAVDTIEITARGSGYSFATAVVQGNSGITGNLVANNANVVPIIGPKGGHGSDVINELYGDTVGVSVDFENSESSQIPAVNDFRTVTILKDPLFANVVITIANTLTTDEATGTGTSFTDGETITQDESGATGIVSGRSAGTVTVSNVYGQFLTTTSSNTTHRLVGQSSNTSTTIASFKTNERSGSSFSVFDQRTRLTGFVNASSLDFQVDEQIIQDTTDTEAFIHSINTTASANVLAVTNKKGNFNESEAGSEVYIRGQSSEAQGYFTGEAGPDITPHTGEVIYVENITPITRSDSQTERVKLMIKF